MKTFIVALMFILAAVMPILFFPLLALTLVVVLIIAPSAIKNGIWEHHEDHKHNIELKH